MDTTVGVVEGASELGEREGALLGPELGIALGNSKTFFHIMVQGEKTGTAVGVCDGCVVGAVVGAAVGSEVGVLVGELLGFEVGESVGH